ncbi:MAG: hypothetical protein E6H59_02455 [Betaproteobacteria bacterium]|nr:MAG: hypothetical protein E6H59_02455 [Betaproteobacteria bacterium]
MNAKVLLGFVAAVAFLAIAQYVFLLDLYGNAPLDASGWLILHAVAVGIPLSVLLTGCAIRKLLSGELIDLGSSTRRGSKMGSYLGGFGAYPFALFLGLVIGVTLGGGAGEIVSEAIGLGTAGVVVGIGLGIFVVTEVVCIGTAFLGFLVGGLTEKLLTRKA